MSNPTEKFEVFDFIEIDLVKFEPYVEKNYFLAAIVIFIIIVIIAILLYIEEEF